MNTIVILCDTLRRDHCNPYTGGRPTPLNECWDPLQPDWAVPTPNMQRLADRGTTFTNCWSGSTPCMPARRDIYTGRFEFLERGWGPLEEWDADLPSQVSGGLPRRSIREMRDKGHRVSQLVTDHMCLWCKGSGNYHMGYTGFEFVRGHQWDNYLTDPVEADAFGCPLPDRDGAMERHWRNVHRVREEKGEAGWFAARTFTTATDWVRRNHDQHENWYLHIDCFDPHEPWDPPRELVEPFMPDAYEVDGWSAHAPYVPWEGNLSEELFNSFRARYAAMVVLVDRWLGRLLDAMDELDLWKDTLLIFTTDHGTWNGERGRIGKLGTHQFDGGGHIPLIACHPGAGRGQTREQLVQLVDIYPTVLAAVGRPLPELPDHRPLHGVNLLPAIEGRNASTRDFAITGMFGASTTITDGRWALHQPPVESNRPLHWHGYTNWDFIQTGPLGPVVDGRREVLNTGQRHTWGTWLSDRGNDPVEYTNLADQQPEKLREMQRALRDELIRLKAPDEQLDRLGLRDV